LGLQDPQAVVVEGLDRLVVGRFLADHHAAGPRVGDVQVDLP
jgi:hypothetical protein